MKVYLVLEHPDGMGGTPKDLSALVHALFLTRERAEDFVQGMIRYMDSYDDKKLLLEAGKAYDGDGTTYFEVIEGEVWV